MAASCPGARASTGLRDTGSMAASCPGARASTGLRDTGFKRYTLHHLVTQEPSGRQHHLVAQEPSGRQSFKQCYKHEMEQLWLEMLDPMASAISVTAAPFLAIGDAGRWWATEAEGGGEAGFPGYTHR
nr:hypothetical protein Itr_chr06CG12710 [Ipomoea trifida]